MVIRGGENVHCSEVESVIYELDEVAEAAVFGLPDERLGEEVAAAVVLVPGARLDQPGLIGHLEGRLARFKHPRHVWFLDEALPRNANGKFLKRELRETPEAEQVGARARPIRARPWPERPVSAANKSGMPAEQVGALALPPRVTARARLGVRRLQ